MFLGSLIGRFSWLLLGFGFFVGLSVGFGFSCFFFGFGFDITKIYPQNSFTYFFKRLFRVLRVHL